jgi:hypothetical protein
MTNSTGQASRRQLHTDADLLSASSVRVEKKYDMGASDNEIKLGN